MKRRSNEEIKKWVEEFRTRQQQRIKELDPFLMPADKPVMISFSGGRTSGYMLRKILDRYGGVLPEHIKVCFRNTGMEFEKSLEFVEKVSFYWNVPITWLEYRYLKGLPKDQKHTFVEVDFLSASRKGEPFSSIIEARSDVREFKGEEPFVPNQGMRYCTGELKQNTLLRWLRSKGIYQFYNCIGVRGDEPKRWERIIDCKSGHLPGEIPLAPLFDSRAKESDVLDFWKEQPFDLDLLPEESNCTLCFLKALPKLSRIAHKNPDLVDWWQQHEERTNSEFRRGKPYKNLLSLPVISCSVDGEDEEPCHCTD